MRGLLRMDGNPTRMRETSVHCLTPIFELGFLYREAV